MSGRGRVNQKHPDFPKYVDEYKKLHNELIRKEDELLDPFFSFLQKLLLVILWQNR